MRYITMAGVLTLLVSCNETTITDTNRPIVPKTWSFESSIRALEIAPDGSIWWAGSNGLLGHSADNGETWSVDTLTLPNGTVPSFRSVAVTDSAAYALTIASPAVLYRRGLIEGVWSPVYVNLDSAVFYDSMAFWDEQEGLAMGDPVEDCLSLLITRDGGRSWNPVPCTDLPAIAKNEEGVREAAFAASNGNIAIHGDEAWVVTGGIASRVYRTEDRGRTWSVVETPIVQGSAMTGMFSVDRCDDLVGLGWGGNWDVMEDNLANRVITVDGGASWALHQPGEGPGYRSCVQYVPQSNCQGIWAVGIPGISQSWDGGLQWSTEPDSSFYTVRFTPDGRTAWLAGRGKIALRPVNKPAQ
ncbi:MAG: oxidoreductase [Bacteroidetes bacterium]|nr:oxidoreductase [Bacteroidota bacterium]